MNQELLTARRKEIIQAAEKVFDASGFSATTMDMVAAEAGIAKGSIYNYFRSKNDLFEQVCAEAFAVSDVQAKELLADAKDATEKLRRLIRQWYSELAYNKKIGRLVLEFWMIAARQEQHGSLSGFLKHIYDYWKDRFVKIFEEGVKAGQFRSDINPEVASSLILAAFNGLELHSILGLNIKIEDDFVSAMENMILKGLSVV